jgi:OmpA-OmpF porin, OOP family
VLDLRNSTFKGFCKLHRCKGENAFMKLLRSIVVVLLIHVVGMAVFAQEPPDEHPLVKKYPGSESMGGPPSVREFDEFELIIAPIAKGGKPSKTQHLEGKIFSASYRNPANRSVLEIYKNYEQALARAGFQTLFACNGVQCGAAQECCPHPTLRDPSYLRRFLAAKLSRPEGDVYVSLAVQAQDPSSAGETMLDVIETKPMESKDLVDAAGLAESVSRTGHAAVYGIYFDTGKADVKPESGAALKEIAKLLQQDVKLKLYVVGHTDNQGTLESNMDLSRRRSAAVAQVLTAKYGVAAARLAGQGVGPLSPVAPNDSEEGRAKNRRVELVKQ